MDADALLRRSRIAQGAENLPGNMSAVERRDVCGVDRMEQIPRGKDAVSTCTQPGVDNRAQVTGVHLESTQSG